MQTLWPLILGASLLGCAAPAKPASKPLVTSSIASSPSATPATTARDLVERYASLREAAMSAVRYRVTLDINEFEASTSTSFGIDASLAIRIAKNDDRVEGRRGSSEYLYRGDAFECARVEERSGGEEYAAVYCVDTGGIVQITQGDVAVEAPRAPDATEIHYIFSGAHGILGQLPDVELTAEGTCSSSRSFEPLDLGSVFVYANVTRDRLGRAVLELAEAA